MASQPSTTQLTPSSPGPASRTGWTRPPGASRADAASFAKRLFGYYRTGEANDPGQFVTGIAEVMTHYPVAVLRTITDPMRGLPGRSRFVPNVAEVKAACEAEMARLAEQSRAALPPPDRAEEIDPGVRARGVALLERVAAEIRARAANAGSARPHVSSEAEARAAALEELEEIAKPRPPIPASAGLLARLRDEGFIASAPRPHGDGHTDPAMRRR